MFLSLHPWRERIVCVKFENGSGICKLAIVKKDRQWQWWLRGSSISLDRRIEFDGREVDDAVVVAVEFLGKLVTIDQKESAQRNIKEIKPQLSRFNRNLHS